MARSTTSRSSHQPARRFGVTEILAFDAETRTDFAQSFMFGTLRLFVDGACVEEGIVVADDLDPTDRAVVDEYAATHEADVGPGYGRRLVVMGLRQWINARFYTYAVARKATVVGANLSFDLGALVGNG